MRLEITLAGDVSVARGDGASRHVLTGPPRVVLAALALSPDAAIDRDRLAGVVWPEAMPRTWASALRTHVSRVRAAVSTVVGAGESVVSGEAGYQLVLPTGVATTVDLDRADQALAAARTALADDPSGALEQATTAADLVRPPFLAGHPGRWADGIRAHLDDLMVGALEVATEAAIALGDGPRAVAAAEDAVQRAPLRESAHRSLMVALDAAGNRAEALRAYQRLRRSLVEELGIDPSPETDAAYLELLGPAPASRLARAAADDDRPTHAAGLGRSHGPGATPFVGRRAELEVLAAAWDQAAAGGRHLVVVTGEAGIGKSRLTVEAAWRVRRDGGLVLFGRCDQEAIVPYQPLVEALDGLVAATPPDELPFLGDEAMAELGAVLPSLDRPRRPAGPDRARLFGAVTDLVAAVAKERPLLLVLDDLQWADDDTLLLVRHLLRRAGDAPVLVMAISRDHDLEPGHALADVVHSLDRDGWVRRLPLRGLDVAEVRELLGHLHGPGDHAQAARRLTAETAGNPFLVTELARSGGLSSGGDTIPQSVQDLVTTRLHRLDADAVELLRAGAVAGARFDLDIAGRAAGLDDRALLDAVDAALASGLVVEETDAICRFPHDIVRRTLVTHLSGPRRRSLHGRTADAIEELRAHDIDAHAAILAHHTSAGADPAGDHRAVRWARRASAHAARRSAPAEAVRLCRQALAHLPPGDSDLEAEVTTDLGIAELAAGDADGARTLIEGATLARRHDRPEVLARAALALADAADDRPDLRRQARDLVAAATAAGAVIADPERGADADAHDLPTADVETDARDVQQARLLVRQLRLADEPGDRDHPEHSAGGAPRPPARALAALHRHISASTDPRAVDERLRLADELALLAVAAGAPAFRVLAAHEQATAAATLGDEATMRSALASLTALVDRHGDPYGAALLAERAVAQLTTDGRFEEARQALELAVTAAAAHHGTGGADGASAVAGRHLVVIDWLTGRAPAREPSGGLLAIDEAPGDQRLHLLGVAALAAVDRGDPAAATEVRGRLAPYADLMCGLGYRTFLGTATFHLGRLAAVAGDWADAERHLLSALRLHSAWRARPWVALTQHSLAGVLEARGRPSDREWIAGLRAEAAWVTETLGLRAPAASDER